MGETIHETPSIIAVFDAQTKKFSPWRIKWRGRVYTVTEIGYHYTRESGSTLHHIFSVATNSLYFRLNFNSKTLAWTIEGILDNTV